MLKLRDYFFSDLNTFLNEDEFAEEHELDGVLLPVIVDKDRLKERSKKEYDGISVGEVLLFVKKENLGKKIEQGAPMIFNGRPMYIFDLREDVGMFEIILSQNRGV